MYSPQRSRSRGPWEERSNRAKVAPMKTRGVYVVDAIRTPIGRYKGALAAVRPDDLAAHVIASLVARNPGLAPLIDQVVFGATNQGGEDNRNVARMASLIAGLPYDVPGVTVNRLCGSGLEAINDAARMIALGEASVAIAGGVESMTRAPFSMPKAAEAFDRTPPPVYDTTLGWRYPNPKMAARFELQSMGETAENVAKKGGITREEQDEFALASQKKAGAAWEAGAFAREIVAVPIEGKKGEAPPPFSRDESPRPDTTLEKLAKLPAAFRKGGSVTAGNSSPINDGSAAVLLVAEELLAPGNITPLARLVAAATAGVEPNLMGEGPIPATRKVLARAGLRAPNLDLIELNEAFAAQSIACIRGLDLDPARVNVNGGSLALGHPIGASGARIVATLVHAMAARNARCGLASLCIGVGQGIATLFERALSGRRSGQLRSAQASRCGSPSGRVATKASTALSSRAASLPSKVSLVR
jgi:acetyl-CoA acyltransferase